MVGQRSGPTLRELKSRVYELAAVKSTQALKAVAEPLARLDFRRRSAWLQALSWLESGRSFEQWLAQPPEEYRALFSEIDAAMADLRAGIDQGVRLSREFQDAADELEREVQRQRNREEGGRLN